MATLQSFSDPGQLTPEWLTDRLRQNGHLPEGEVVSVYVKARHKHHLALEVAYSASAPAALPREFILKWYQHPEGVREGLFYREIVPQMPAPPVPSCYDVAVDDGAGHTHILLQDRTDTHSTLTFPPENFPRERFVRIVTSYLAFHAHWWEHPRIRQPDLIEPRAVGVAREATTAAGIEENQRHFTRHVLPRRREEWDGQLPAACWTMLPPLSSRLRHPKLQSP
jgi:hypothetical protein